MKRKLSVILMSLLVSLTLFAQSKNIKGVVKDGTGQSVIGAVVLQEGTQNGTVTSVDGEFEIKVPKGATIRISGIGYEDVSFVVDDRAVYDVTMNEAALFLDEVVVVGMDNRQTRRSITGAVSTVSTSDLIQSPVANISNALAGKLPGLVTVQSSGEPGADASSLYVRGLGTYGDSSPLVVIDGLPRNKSDFDQLDANEIESVTILKDASSSSLYGIQGANGVVVVTTKRGGTNDKPKISFSAQGAMQQPIRLPRTMTSYEQAMYNRELDANDGQPVRYTEEVLDIIASGRDPYQFPNTNWFDVVLKKLSWQQQYNLNISGTVGKSHKVRYFISGSYLNQGTLINHQNEFRKNYGMTPKFDRFNFRSNIDIDATKMLNIRVDLSHRLETKVGPGSSFTRIFQVITTRLPSSQAIWNPNGTLAAGSALEMPYQNNPYGLITQGGYYTTNTNVTNGTVSARHTLDFITKGLSVQLYFSFENYNYVNHVWSQDFDQFWFRGEDASGQPIYQDYTTKSRLVLSGSSYVERFMYYDLRLNYDRSFGDHNVSAQVLGNRTLKNIQFQLPYAYQGISTRVAYNYANRYFAEFNLGFNGSENFPAGKRYGVFPSGSLGWVMSDEPWMKDAQNWLKILKLRASYGTVGNDKVGGARWLYVTEYTPGGARPAFNGGGYVYFGKTTDGTTSAGGYNESQVGNPDVTWEVARKLNAGIDISLFRNNILNITFDYFRENRDNILTPPGNIPSYVGITNIASRNTGKVMNQGVEGEIRVNQQIDSKFGYFVNFQCTYAKNVVLENDQPTPAYDYQSLKGLEIGNLLGYHAIGIFQNWQEIEDSPRQTFGPVRPGDIKYMDVNNDGVIDPNDRIPIKVSNIPVFTSGLSLGFNLYDFDFSIMMNAAFGGTAMLYTYASSVIQNQRWSKTNRTSRIPAAHSTANNTVVTDNFLMKTDYFKIRNIEVGYNIPERVTSKIRIKNARVYFNAQNVAVFDTLWLKDRDPESAGSGTLPYPLQRVFNIGLRFDI